MVKKLPASAGDAGGAVSIPGSGRSPGGGNGNPLQYACLGNPMDRRAWRTTVHGITKELETTEYTHNGLFTLLPHLPTTSLFYKIDMTEHACMFSINSS